VFLFCWVPVHSEAWMCIPRFNNTKCGVTVRQFGEHIFPLPNPHLHQVLNSPPQLFTLGRPKHRKSVDALVNEFIIEYVPVNKPCRARPVIGTMSHNSYHYWPLCHTMPNTIDVNNEPTQRC